MHPVNARFAPYQKFIGQKVNHCFDEITSVAYNHGYSHVVMGFSDGVGNIDVEPGRFVVHVNSDDTVVSFSIG